MMDLRVGSARIIQITEVDRWPFVPTDLLPDVKHDEVAEARLEFGPSFVGGDSNELVLAIHTYVIRIGDTTIVVDTGNGNHKERPHLLAHHRFDTDYLDRFAAAGVDVGEVDLVVNTHLHPDHCGWNTTLVDGVWQPTFPHATYVFVEEELRPIEGIASDPSVEGVLADIATMYEDSIRPVLDDSRHVTISGEHLLAELNGTTVTMRPAPGHSPGHIVVEVRNDAEGAVLCGDVIHHPVQLSSQHLSQGGDTDPTIARTTRHDFMQRCADEQLLILTAHFPVSHPVRVERTSSGELAWRRLGGGSSGGF